MVDGAGACGQLIEDVEFDGLLNARRFAGDGSRAARAFERRFETGLFFDITRGNPKALLHYAVPLLGFLACVESLCYQVTLLAEGRDYVEALLFADDQVVPAGVDSEAFADEDLVCAIEIAPQTEAADDAAAMKRTVVELVLFARIAKAGGEVVIGQQVAAEIVGPLKTDVGAAGGFRSPGSRSRNRWTRA